MPSEDDTVSVSGPESVDGESINPEHLGVGSWNWVDVTKNGVDSSGTNAVETAVNELTEDNTLLRFPEGDYRLSGTMDLSGYDEIGMVAERGATFVPDAEISTDLLLDTGLTSGDAADNIYIERLRFDFSTTNTGGGLRFHVLNSGYVKNLQINGVHDNRVNNNTTFEVAAAAVSGGGEIHLADVRIPDGAVKELTDTTNEFQNLYVGNQHNGRLVLNRCHFAFGANNCAYINQSSSGTTIVMGGRFSNSDRAQIRIDGGRVHLYNPECVVNTIRPGFNNTRGIWITDGADHTLHGPNVRIEEAGGSAQGIRVDPGAGAVSMYNPRVHHASGAASGGITTHPAEGALEDSLVEIVNPRVTGYGTRINTFRRGTVINSPTAISEDSYGINVSGAGSRINNPYIISSGDTALFIGANDVSVSGIRHLNYDEGEDVKIDHAADVKMEGSLSGVEINPGIRTIINGKSKNRGDPNITGDWYGQQELAERTGIVIDDISNDRLYRATGSGTWIQIG